MLIDTNIFLELLLDQGRADECLSFLQKVEQGQISAYVTDFALHSLAVIIERTGGSNDLAEAFVYLSAFQGLTLLHASLEEHSEIASFTRERGLDFDDGYQAFLALKINVPIISFDRHFDGVVERREPRDVLT